ncbi:MAG: hypothetical protein KIT72_07810 [Polyangiaceae bacterium]|nr:hypothetical protein [Polyangiaceae bacterium]MCW5790310.1 hypothetical protein [Polyangiaceae bacterium]
MARLSGTQRGAARSRTAARGAERAGSASRSARRGAARGKLFGALTALMLGAVTLAPLGCAGSAPARSSLDELREQGPTTRDPATAERWYQAELLSVDGDAKRAASARDVLDKLGVKSARAHVLRGIDDLHHGRTQGVSGHFFAALAAARDSEDPEAQLFAWYAAHEGIGARSLAAGDLWESQRGFVEAALKAPGHIGWRARAELVEWVTDVELASAQQGAVSRSVAEFGCVPQLRLAGPFGRRVSADAVRSFEAEQPGPWPSRFKPAPGSATVPRILKTEARGCTRLLAEPAPPGVFYAETFLELEETRDLILVAQGAVAMWVDDALVLDRDPRRWGEWPRFGVALRLAAGRHRVLARLPEARTSLRVLTLDGRPAKVTGSTDAAAPYAITPPTKLADPNPLMRFVEAARGDIKGEAPDDLLRFVAASLAHVENQDDVASVLIQPLVKQPTRATGVALTTAAMFASGDAIYGGSQGDDLVRSLHQAAAKRDPSLWSPRVSLTLREGAKGLTESVKPLQALAEEFPDVPSISSALASVYGELGWEAERLAVIDRLGERFPRDPDVLTEVLASYQDRGDFKKSDELMKRILELDPDSEVRLDDALARQDYAAAKRELERLSARRPERQDLLDRLEGLLVRAGQGGDELRRLEKALEREPRDVVKRLALADARFATGEHGALREALVAAVTAGADPAALSEAIDLVEGVTELEPYRVKTEDVIAAYEASGEHMEGTAARVLDYSAVVVRSDGSSRMLTHDIIRLQSGEAIGRLAEQEPPAGMVLKMRVIKRDGTKLEPEFVSGKPTVTMPHLEVGDYIEREYILSQPGDAQQGRVYYGPRWFFREENIAFFRSQFVLVTPRGKPLVIEARGDVPEPKLTQDGAREVRDWLVTKNPAAPVEPLSAPVTEFLPSVHVGWGVTLEDRLRHLNDGALDLSPMDPRVRAIARKIAEPERRPSAQVKKLYHWVIANIEEGEETDGRRVIVGKQGNRWKAFITLCRALNIDARYVVAKSRLSTPAVGTLSEAAEYNKAVLRVKTEQGDTWLTLGTKFLPFGYVPDDIRGMPAYQLGGARAVAVTVPKEGGLDLIEHLGEVRLQKNGSAEIELTQRYHGKYAAGLRSALAQLPESQLKDVIESKLLGAELRGARLVRFEIERRDDVDAPLTLKLTADMSVFAQLSAGALVIDPPFSPRVAQLATLPSRQTPLFLSDATHIKSELKIVLPEGLRVDGALPAYQGSFQQHSGRVSDRVEGQVLTLSREIYLGSGRVQPGAYAEFQRFARQLDDALNGAIRVR